MPVRLTESQEDEIYRRWVAGESLRGLGRAFGTDFHTAKRGMLRARSRASENHSQTSDAVSPQTQQTKQATASEVERDPVDVERERLDRTRKLQAERDAIKALAGEKSFRGFLESLVRDVVDRLAPPPPYAPQAPLASLETTETLYLALSDWHAYEAVQPQRVMGLNQYDADVFGRRVRRVISTTLDIKARLERGGWRFPRLVVGVNGDMLSGTIHEVERHSDAPNIVLAAFGCGRVLAEAVRDLSAHFEAVDVVCTSGNHGRLPDARKVQSKDPTRSWNTLVALVAATALEKHQNVRFHIPDSYHALIEIEGWRLYQTHGHGIKSQLGIPFYGLRRHAGNIVTISNLSETPVTYCVYGHFHSASSMPNVIGETFINGSLIGGTEYGIDSYGSVDRPRQLLLGFHAEHGVTHRWPILAGKGLEGPGYAVRTWERFT